MHDRLVVGFDGSEAAAAAVDWAAQEAALRDDVLEIVSCYALPLPYDPSAMVAMTGREVDAFRESCEVEVARMAERVQAAHPGLGVEQRVTIELPVDTLVEASGGADLVVVGNSRHGILHSLLLGSVAHALTRRSQCPVAVIRAEPGAVRRGTVVVGIDGSEASDRALDWAVDEADRRRSTLRVVHAWEPVYDDLGTGSQTLRELAEVDAACTLDRAVERAVQRAGCKVEPLLVKDLPDHALVVAGRDADLLVIGSRGRGEVRSVLFGSVAHAVTQTATRPVVVVPAAPQERGS